MASNVTAVTPNIEASWLKVMSDEFQAPYFLHLKQFLQSDRDKHRIFPSGPQIFSAFNLCPLSETRVVLLGQDPYHGPGQAHGLSFSVPAGIPQPPSLVNILKELKSDEGIESPSHGNLESWAKQGVLLLNSVLTVRCGEPGSHRNQGWEKFTDAAIHAVSRHNERCVFLLWGSYARAKKSLIDPQKHLILESPHPSPLSAYRGFFGCKHFSKANDYLLSYGRQTIRWALP